MKKRKYFLLIIFLFICGVNRVFAVSCGNVSDIPERIPKITSRIVSILQVAVPVLMIIFGALDFARGMTSGKSDDMGQRRKIFIKRLITGVIVFFVIVIVKLLVSVVADSVSSANISSCIDCFISNNCYEGGSTSSNNKKVKTGSVSNAKNNSSLSDKVEKNQSSKQKPENQNNSNNSNNSGTVGGTASAKANTMYIGDSRTYFICAFLSDAWTGCSFPNTNNSGYVYNEELYIAQSAMGYNWFVNTAIGAANTEKGSTPYNIFVLMGVNDGVSSVSGAKSVADKYYDKVAELAQGDWKNDNVLYVSITPVNSSASVSNDGINSFNEEMKSKISSANISNLKYCDISSKLTSEDIASLDADPEGVHYNTKTANEHIHSYLQDCLK